MDITKLIEQTLVEDIATADITSSMLIDPNETGTAHIIAKETGIFFGTPIVSALNDLLKNSTISVNTADGTAVQSTDICLTLTGNIKEIVEIERTLLNFLQRLSGVATITNAFVKALDDSSIQVLDTRKTTPLFRALEKEAVKAGGGYNHRFGLYDMVLVKENHLQRYLKQSKLDQFNTRLNDHKLHNPTIPIEVEVADLNLLTQLDLAPIDIILFDNMEMSDLNSCLEYLKQQDHQVLKEVSGNISLTTIGRYKGIDIDRISVGSLTHSVKALDLSLIVL